MIGEINNVFDLKTIDDIRNLLKDGFIVDQKDHVFVTKYMAIKKSKNYSREEMNRLIKKNKIKFKMTDSKRVEDAQVWLPDILFLSWMREAQNCLIKLGITKELKPDRHNYESLTDQQNEQFFLVLGKFISKFNMDTKMKILNLSILENININPEIKD